MKSRELGIAFAATLLVMAPSAAGISSKAELASAPVPSACGHPAGTLVDGILLGIPEGQGGVALDRRNVVLGRIVPGGGQGAAAALTCSQGGVSWPQVLVFYDKQLRLIHHVDLYRITRGGRESVKRTAIANGVVAVQVVAIEQSGDLASGGTASALLRFGWDRSKRRIRLLSKATYNELAVARAFVAAIRAGNVTAARRYAGVASVAKVMRSPGAVRNTFRIEGCGGILSADTNPLGDSDFGDAPRRCYVTAAGTGYRYREFALKMAPVTWRTWRVADVLPYLG